MPKKCITMQKNDISVPELYNDAITYNHEENPFNHVKNRITTEKSYNHGKPYKHANELNNHGKEAYNHAKVV